MAAEKGSMKELKAKLEWLEDLKKEAATNKLIAVVLALALAIVGVLYMDREVKVIYGPPTALQKPIEITNPRMVDAEWARFFAQVLMNFTPEDIENRKNMVLPYVAPQFRLDFVNIMNKAQEDALQYGIYQLFREESVEIGKDGTFYIKGTVRRYVRQKAPMDEKVEVVMKVKGGKLYDFRIAPISGQ